MRIEERKEIVKWIYRVKEYWREREREWAGKGWHVLRGRLGDNSNVATLLGEVTVSR